MMCYVSNNNVIFSIRSNNNSNNRKPLRVNYYNLEIPRIYSHTLFKVDGHKFD